MLGWGVPLPRPPSGPSPGSVLWGNREKTPRALSIPLWAGLSAQHRERSAPCPHLTLS